MKVAVINLPTMRPTMPPYVIGVLGKIVQSIKNVECEVFDFNLLFWDKMLSQELDVKVNLISRLLLLDETMSSRNAARLLKKTTTSFELFEKSIIRIEKEMKIIESIYDVKVKFGEISLINGDYTIKDLIKLCSDSEKNIFYNFSKMVIKNNSIESYDVILLSIMCKEQLLSAFTLANLIKLQKNKKTKIAIGGAFVNRFLKNFENQTLYTIFDYILVGRGEFVIPYCLKMISENDFRLKKRIVSENDVLKTIDAIPKVTREYNTYYGNIDVQSYYNSVPIMPVMASRSCYYHRCAFCDNAYNYLGKDKMKQEVIDVLRQMEEIEKKYGITRFYFIDDCLAPKFIRSFCQLLIENKKKYKWFANARFSLELKDKKLINLMAMAGCKEIFLGMESYSNSELDRMKKGIKKEWILPTITAMKEENIAVYISVMVGYPGETKRDYESTKHFLFNHANLIDMIDINIFRPTLCSEIGRKIFDNISENDKKNFLNDTFDFRGKEEQDIVEKRFNELKTWVIKNRKEASYWKRNCYMK